VSDFQARSSVRWVIETSMVRSGKHFNIGTVGGGSRWQRLFSAIQILRWNRWAARDARNRGVDFPQDCPQRLRDVDWRRIWTN